MEREGADAAGLAMAAGIGLIATSLFASWGERHNGFGWSVDPQTGGDWLVGGRDIALAVVAALLAPVTAARLARRRPSRAALALTALVLLVVAGWIAATSLTSSTIEPPARGGFATRSDVSLGQGPLVAGLGALLASAGLASARGAPARRLPPRSLALLVAAGALLVALPLDWTAEGPWLDPLGADAWFIYAWADVGITVAAAAIALAGALPRHPALAALPVSVLALPFLDRGFHPSGPGGFAESEATAGSAVRVGAMLALAAAVLALAALVGRPTGRLSERVSRGPSSPRSRRRRRGRRSGPSPTSASAP